jgi:hypothetical protein
MQRQSHTYELDESHVYSCAAATVHVQVNRILLYKRSLLKEVPFFEARARASASLAVVQDYLLASIHHLQDAQQQQEQQQQQEEGGGGSQPPALSAPSWQGTANVRRPAASWIT